MEQLSKEEILGKVGKTLKECKQQFDSDKVLVPDHMFNTAMDIHSKQTAIAFKNWLDKRSRMLMDEAGQMPVIIFSKVETTEQLYELFIQSLK